MNNVMVGVVAAIAIMVTVNAFSPKPAECTAGKDLKESVAAQQQASSDMAKSQQKTIGDLLALEKKAVETMAASCKP